MISTARFKSDVYAKQMYVCFIACRNPFISRIENRKTSSIIRSVTILLPYLDISRQENFDFLSLILDRERISKKKIIECR